MDMHTVLNAQEVEKSPGRMQAAKSFAINEAERFTQLAKRIPDQENKEFNGSVKKSRMNPNA